MTDEQLQQLLALDGAPGPALAISAARADALIGAALDGAGFGPGGGGDGGGGSDASGPRGPSGVGSPGGTAGAGTMAVGTKVAIVAGVAVIAIAIAVIVWRGTGGDPAQLAAAPIDAAIDAPIDAAALGGAPPDQAVVAPSPSDPPPDAPPSRAKPPRREPSPGDAADLLGEANAKRAAKQWRESDALYARVVQRAPDSLAAQTALIASGSLRLEHLGDPKGAARRFRRALALAPAGPLAEEARWGLAEAARAMRDTAAEAAALDDFLAHHARSPLAQRAKARRAELP